MTAEQNALFSALPPHADGVNLGLPELLHYQKQAIRWLPPAVSIWSQLSGQHGSRQKGRGMNFSEVRPYQAGDDIRAIDWRVTARTGKTHTKLFTEEREQPVMLLVDLSQSMKFGSQLLLKSVQAAHFASLISWLVVSQQDRIGALIFNGHSLKECKPTARQQGPLRLIHSLMESHQELLSSDAPPANGYTWQDTLRHLHHLCPKGSDIIIISDFYALTSMDKRRLTQLRQHNRMQFIHISDPLEQGNTPFRGHELVSDQQRTAWVNFSSPSTRNSLALQFETHQQFIADIAKSLAIPVHTITAAQALIQQIKNKNTKAS